jgi:hypothetical protein
MSDADFKIIIPCQIRKTEQDNIGGGAHSRIRMALECWEIIHRFEKTAAV